MCGNSECVLQYSMCVVVAVIIAEMAQRYSFTGGAHGVTPLQKIRRRPENCRGVTAVGAPCCGSISIINNTRGVTRLFARSRR
jgi:hypothetical protein